jgi:predicted RND superfamily exporter protein
MTSVFLDRYTAFIVHDRWLVIVSAAAVMLVLAVGVQFITASNDWSVS